MKKLPIYLLSLSLLASCSSDKSTPQGGDSVTSGETTSAPVVGGTSPVESEVVVETEVPVETPSLENLSRTIVDALESGEYEEVVDYFDETLTEALDVSALKKAWESTVSSLGDYVGAESVRVTGDMVMVTEEYAQKNLEVTLVFGEDALLSGINLNYGQVKMVPTESEFFVEEEITIATEEHLPLGGFLTMPVGVETPPVVLLVQGSGSTDRNSSIYENVPFADIAHGLAEEGIASLRYDKRFYTYPQEALALGVEMTLEDEILDDVSTALHFLEEHKELGDVYLLGHSLGGMLSPSIATSHPVVKGIITVGGSPQPLYEISYTQNKETEALILGSLKDEMLLAMIAAEMEQVEEDILTLRGDFSHLSADEVLMGLPVMYQQSVKDHAGENFLEDLSIPMLVLQGTEDFQVSPTVDFGLYQDLLEDRENVTFYLYEGLNHLMMESEIRDVSDYQIKNVVYPEVIEDIAIFIHGQEG